jgi:hypothetical protein
MAVSDPYYDSVDLLAPLNVNFYDYSKYRRALSAYNGAVISSGASKGYAQSCYFDGVNDYLAYPEMTGITGNADFTFEVWAYLTKAATEYWRGLFVRRVGGNAFGLVIRDTSISFEWWESAVYNALHSSADTLLNRWAHISCGREGNIIYISVDGVVQSAAIGSVDSASGAGWIGGAGYTDRFFKGYLQDIRITKGVARYKEDFVPPRPMVEFVPGGAIAVDANTGLRNVGGTITDRFGQPCQRKIYAVSRPTDATAPQILAHGLSDPMTGNYDLVIPSGGEVTRVVVSEDDDPLLNDLVDRVIPA